MIILYLKRSKIMNAMQRDNNAKYKKSKKLKNYLVPHKLLFLFYFLIFGLVKRSAAHFPKIQTFYQYYKAHFSLSKLLIKYLKMK